MRTKLDLVVVGLGYVGMPLVEAATLAGLRVVGFDTSEAVVSGLNSGLSHVDDLSETDLAGLLQRGFTASSDPGVLGQAETVVICVPTPLGREGGPELDAVVQASEQVAEHLSPGMLVVLESTTWPGTTEEVVRPILERSGLQAGSDFALAFSPERIDPGNAEYGLANTPKVIGGLSAACTERAAEFYSRFVGSVVKAAGTREAEMAKLLENTYRQVNIALVNEMCKFSEELGVDFWDVIRCARTKPFGFQAFYPGPGVGGHCIPIDPSYLSHRVQVKLGYPFRFVELAQEINRSMPRYVAQRAQRILNRERKPVNGSRILLLGVTYKPGIADQRESPALALFRELQKSGAQIAYYDPFVPTWTVDGETLDRVADLRSELAHSDLVIHLQHHRDYAQSVIDEVLHGPVLDTRGVFDGPRVERL